MEIHFSKSKIYKLFLLSALITILGYKVSMYESVFATTIGAANIFIGSLCFATALYVLFCDKPAIIVDENGIYDHRATKNPIPWKQIANAEVIIFRNEKVLQIKLQEQIKPTEFTFLRRLLGQIGKNKQISLNLNRTMVHDSALSELLSEKIQ